MASRLDDTTQYGLSCSNFSGTNKTVLHVKLTDAALKSIEEYKKTKSLCSRRPSIHFKGNKGVITFPGADEDGKHSQRHEFRFIVQQIPAPENSSFECIEHFTNRSGIRQLDSVGRMQTKISIHATDEVYASTKEKMMKVDENMKKVSTQQVSQKDIKAGRKVKRKDISQLAKTTLAERSTSSQMVTPPTTLKRPSPVPYSSSSSFNKSAISTKSLSTKPVPSPGGSTKSSNGQTKKSNTHSGPKKSCRERIIHLLALRPYKKPEIVLRLRKEGISEKDKKQLGAILSQVATLSRDNSYNLHRRLYNEVQEDWPYYSEENKKQLKARLEEMRVRESPSSSQPSPNAPEPEQEPPIKQFQKRQLLPENIDYKPPKKIRKAYHTIKYTTDEKTSPAHNNNHHSTLMTAIASSQGAVEQKAVSSPSVSTTRCSPDSSDSTHLSVAPAPTQEDESTQEEKKSSVKSESRDTASPVEGVSSTSSALDNLASDFPPLSSQEQRQKYKEIFNKEYMEYIRLYTFIYEQNQKFEHLKKEFRTTPKSSPYYKTLIDKIYREEQLLREKGFYEERKKCNELHNKLEHIKAVIVSYDNAQKDIYHQQVAKNGSPLDAINGAMKVTLAS